MPPKRFKAGIRTFKAANRKKKVTVLSNSGSKVVKIKVEENGFTVNSNDDTNSDLCDDNWVDVQQDEENAAESTQIRRRKKIPYSVTSEREATRWQEFRKRSFAITMCTNVPSKELFECAVCHVNLSVADAVECPDCFFHVFCEVCFNTAHTNLLHICSSSMELTG